MADISGVRLPFVPAGGVNSLKKLPPAKDSKVQGAQFGDVFQKELDRLKFSAHAQNRMVSRDIALSESDMKSLESAIQKAEAKGAKETLVLMKDKSFIVSVENKTVITVMNSEQMKDSVITNIDSAVIA